MLWHFPKEQLTDLTFHSFAFLHLQIDSTKINLRIVLAKRTYHRNHIANVHQENPDGDRDNHDHHDEHHDTEGAKGGAIVSNVAGGRYDGWVKCFIKE